MKYKLILTGYFDQFPHCWSTFTAMQCNGYTPSEGICYFFTVLDDQKHSLMDKMVD